MNVVDSCGWLEFFADGPNAEFFAAPLSDIETLIVPTVSLYEVFKRVLVQRGEGDAFQAMALMQQPRVLDLDTVLAMSASKLSVEHRLPMADAIMLASARASGATLWTQNSDFDGLEGVAFVSA